MRYSSIDFNIAIRDIGPIDSIVQTAGRCNRNGTRKATDSPFYIYRVVNENDHEFAKYVYGNISIDISNAILNNNRNHTGITNLVRSYYQEIRRRRSSEKSDSINLGVSELDYENVDNEFELINDQFKMPIFVEYDEEAVGIWERFVNL